MSIMCELSSHRIQTIQKARKQFNASFSIASSFPLGLFTSFFFILSSVTNTSQNNSGVNDYLYNESGLAEKKSTGSQADDEEVPLDKEKRDSEVSYTRHHSVINSDISLTFTLIDNFL